ncbi:hypothetical protein Bpfe_011249 [Biomphalaria pfeifferi]|uniref:Uncharacterized protein n=1 Tax=Biomphalaria pfeifferi TaxID=112525 RepID=A0AAD8BR69_BIOPF|nr:hypothetical protein Bpfe_011249 [Biomphalaria pfeifferi]
MYIGLLSFYDPASTCLGKFVYLRLAKMIPTKKFYKYKEVLELIDNDFNCESAPTAIVSVDTINLPSSDLSSEDVNNFIVSSLLAVEVNCNNIMDEKGDVPLIEISQQSDEFMLNNVVGEWLSEAAAIDPVETVENVLDKGLDGEAVMDTDEPTEEKGSEDEVDSTGVNHKNGSEQTATAKRKIAKKGFTDPSKWKRNANALKRMNGEGRCLKPVKCTCCVQKLDDSLRTELFEQYWLVSWERKRDFILSNTVVTETSRKTTGEKSRRKQSIQYFLPSISGKIKVCQKMFLDTLDIGTKFLQEDTAINHKHVSKKIFDKIFHSLDLSFNNPRKDQCDTCVAYKQGSVDSVSFQEHIEMKDRARHFKALDKELAAENDTLKVVTMDMQQLLLCPKSNASAVHYKRKLSVHNFTLYDLKSKDVFCYLWHEANPERKWETVIKTARRKNPYNVKTVDHQFWKKYPSLVTSIRPGKVVGDPTVTDICHLKYTKEGIFYTLSHGTPLRPLPLRPVRQPSMTLKTKYKHSLPLTAAKIADLKSLCETVIPACHRPFYNSLL